MVINSEEITDFYGNVALLEEMDTGDVFVYEDYDDEKQPRYFSSYDAAAAWIFRRGYRE